METLAAVLQTDGLAWVCFGGALAGLVRGFSGFGTAMVFLPFAGSVLSPVWALVALIVMDILGPLPLVPRALRASNKVDILLLGAGALITLPVGLYFLTQMHADVFRYVVSFGTLAALVILVSGIRYSGVLTKPLVMGIGGLGGFMGGAAGLPGPPVIVFYMASTLPAATIRANLMLYLLMIDLMIFPLLALNGALDLTPVLIGLIAVTPYALGGLIGSRLFDPARETVFRIVAYLVIGTSALVGLPIWRL